jgi:hypothetical protein
MGDRNYNPIKGTEEKGRKFDKISGQLSCHIHVTDLQSFLSSTS